MKREDAKQALLDMKDHKPLYLNWFEEGGAEVFRVNWDWFVLFHIPQYGGVPQYEATYHKSNLDKLIEEVYSWT